MSSCIIFDSDDIVVHYVDGKTDYILVTFIGIGHEESAQSVYFGKPIVERHNITCLVVTTRKRNWYYSHNMHTALRIMRQILEKYNQVITIGLSAGAYAAIKYSRILASQRTLALGPQLTIDDQEGDVIPEWAALCEPSMRGMGLKPDDLHGSIFTLFDRAHHGDAHTVERLLDYARDRSHVDVAPINVPSAGHIVYESLKGSRNLKELIDMLVRPDTAKDCAWQLQKATSVFRRVNTTNLYNRIVSGYHKHPKLVYDMLVSSRFREDFQFRDILRDETLLFRVCARLSEKGYVSEAQILLRGLVDYYASGIYQPGGDDHLIMGVPVMLDHRGRTLGYSARERQFTSSNIVWMEGDATPVSLTHVDRIAYPCISVLGKRLFLDLEEGRVQAVTATGRLRARCRGTTCGIQDDASRYLTVLGDREMAWSAYQLSYETFSVVTI